MAKNHIMLVDDEPNVLRAYERSLRTQCEEWSLLFEDSAVSALKRLRQSPVDVVVTDINMPRMSGLELLRQMQNHPDLKDIPVIIVTGRDDDDLKSEALILGATDLLPKPVNYKELAARLHNALQLKHYTDRLKTQYKTLDQMSQERAQELLRTHSEIVWRLAKAAECRDDDTGNHVVRVGLYSKLVGGSMGLDETYCEALFLAATLHDIGKIGIPDSILLKPGKLEFQEWQTMKQHCAIGKSILLDGHAGHVFSEVGDQGDDADAPNPLLKMAADIALYHHERWDGAGYPCGLTGDDIPLAARIVSIADVYDALRSTRPYKPAYEIGRALDILAEGSGTQFDPIVHEAFLRVLHDIMQVEIAYGDEPYYEEQTCDLPTESVN